MVVGLQVSGPPTPRADNGWQRSHPPAKWSANGHRSSAKLGNSRLGTPIKETPAMGVGPQNNHGTIIDRSWKPIPIKDPLGKLRRLSSDEGSMDSGGIIGHPVRRSREIGLGMPTLRRAGLRPGIFICGCFGMTPCFRQGEPGFESRRPLQFFNKQHIHECC